MVQKADDANHSSQRSPADWNGCIAYQRPGLRMRPIQIERERFGVLADPSNRAVVLNRSDLLPSAERLNSCNSKLDFGLRDGVQLSQSLRSTFETRRLLDSSNYKGYRQQHSISRALDRRNDVMLGPFTVPST